jgi:hypothetical protein
MREEAQDRKLRLSKETLRRLDPELEPKANLSWPISRSCFEPDLCRSYGGPCDP